MAKKKSKFYQSDSKWGGPWTERKLNAFCKYVKSYLLIMKEYPYWQTIYFDGFAGSGEKKKIERSEFYKQLELTEEEERGYKGSAERVIGIDDSLAFNFYYFADTDKDSLTQLETKLRALPSSQGKELIFKHGDANHWIQALSEAMKSKQYAALVFLDPFGMQIDWKSIEALKDTRSDIWILLPTGIIVNRLLDLKGELIFSDKLESFFGMSAEDIRATFYTQSTQTTLFGDKVESISKVDKPIGKIADVYVSKMKSIWKYVTETPLRLETANGTPLFHFVFASNNKTAYKIANEIILKR
jgi:three-Cys-motif partner protein